MRSRRQFIKTMGVLGGAVMAPFRWFGRAQAATLPDAPLPPGAELYGGFLLLPEGTPVPPWVKPRRLPEPNKCGMEENKDILPEYEVIIETFEEVAQAQAKVNFPVYAFSSLPDGLRPAQPYIATNARRDIYGVSVSFEAYDPANDLWTTAVSLWIQPDFPRPFPLWSSTPAGPVGPSVVLEKVDYLPSLGIKVATPLGFVCHWIETDVLFTLIAEPSPTGQDAQALVSLLHHSY